MCIVRYDLIFFLFLIKAFRVKCSFEYFIYLFFFLMAYKSILVDTFSELILELFIYTYGVFNCKVL